MKILAKILLSFQWADLNINFIINQKLVLVNLSVALLLFRLFLLFDVSRLNRQWVWPDFEPVNNYQGSSFHCQTAEFTCKMNCWYYTVMTSRRLDLSTRLFYSPALTACVFKFARNSQQEILCVIFYPWLLYNTRLSLEKLYLSQLIIQLLLSSCLYFNNDLWLSMYTFHA